MSIIEKASPRRRLARWDPEDAEFWRRTGRATARRNLLVSMLCEHVAFSLWAIWSVVVVSLPAAGFAFSVDQLFWLTALPNLIGAALRLPYTYLVAVFGGRLWTFLSGIVLLVPCGLLIYCVSSSASYGVFLLAAGLAGLGGGNFASSMANISHFYPAQRQGTALAINATGGNIGVTVVQVVVPIVISLGTGIHLAYAGVVYLPVVLLSSLLALSLMDDLPGVRGDFRAHAAAATRAHTWVVSTLYIGTFGSFIGYSFAMPLLIATQFPEVPVAHYAWLGPLVGAVSRPLGGWLADRSSGSLVSQWNFAAMAGAAGLVVVGRAAGSFPLFLGAFLVLFVTSGIGNGSTYRMIPAIFSARCGDDPARARREAAAAIGIASAIGAFGGFGVSRAFAMSVASTGTADTAMLGFIACYAGCFALTWWCYRRRAIAVRLVPSLAPANV
ncbi:MFS transporter [Haloechinothrix halophila]|uniref:MFS transporter n=1 Tax=Haloechinothrix halophila TaxID=1069073 RepID=UPI00040A89FD|nr:MFS transporter [Haloechinothrix halophila]